MVLVESASLIVILNFLASLFGKDVKAAVQGDKITIIGKDSNGKEFQSVISLTEGLSYLESISDRVSTDKTVKQRKADIELENDQGRDLRIYNISLVPDATFKTDGIVEILINGRKLLPAKAAGTYTDSDTIGVYIPPQGLILKQRKKLEIFVWTSGGAVALTSMIAVGAE